MAPNPSKKLNSRWFVGTKSPEEKQELEGIVRNSRTVMTILTRVIDQEVAALEAIKSDDYETPAWACKQADRNGQIRALKKLRLMTALTQ